jgi:putative mycofactocin binding protein MftB
MADAFLLSPGVRARREEFGLLFYNSKDAKLTFVKSGDSLKVEQREDGTFLLIPAFAGNGTERRVKAYVASLVKKGLILEASRPF